MCWLLGILAFSSRHLHTSYLPLEYGLMSLSPFFMMVQRHWPSFCVSQSPSSSASRSLLCCFPCMENASLNCLHGWSLLNIQTPAKTCSETPSLNSVYKFSCPTTNPFITGVLKLCYTSNPLENLLKHRLLSRSF